MGLREALKRLADEIRLWFAEWLIWKAVKVAPVGHPESKPIYRAAYCLAAGELAENHPRQETSD